MEDLGLARALSVRVRLSELNSRLRNFTKSEPGYAWGMLVESASPVAQDYLKVIWNAAEWSTEPVTTKHIAQRLGVRMSTVSEQVQRLVASGLLEHERYGVITLTAEGRRLAVAMVRRHRLLEAFLVEHLGYTWDEVHDEAEVLEHAVSHHFIERLDAFLGQPLRDPHGDPIPDAEGLVTPIEARLLADLTSGAGGRVARVSDADPDTLRRFAAAGLRPGAHVIVRTRRRSGNVLVDVNDQQGVVLTPVESQAVWIAADEPQ